MGSLATELVVTELDCHSQLAIEPAPKVELVATIQRHGRLSYLQTSISLLDDRLRNLLRRQHPEPWCPSSLSLQTYPNSIVGQLEVLAWEQLSVEVLLVLQLIYWDLLRRSHRLLHHFLILSLNVHRLNFKKSCQKNVH